jgi:hypothetical protein
VRRPTRSERTQFNHFSTSRYVTEDVSPAQPASLTLMTYNVGDSLAEPGRLTKLPRCAQVPTVGMLPSRRPRRVPYIHSSAEIAALVAEARLTIRSPLRAATIYTGL